MARLSNKNRAYIAYKGQIIKKGELDEFNNIIGVCSVIVVLAMILFNVSLSKIITVLFVSSLGFFIVRVIIGYERILGAFIDSFGLMTIISFVAGYRQPV